MHNIQAKSLVNFAQRYSEQHIATLDNKTYINAVNRLVAFNQSSIIAFHNACGIYRDYLCDYPLCGEA